MENGYHVCPGSRHFLLLLTALTIVLAAYSSTGSLVITFYRNHALYIASDSLSTGKGKPNSQVQKILEISDTCCVAWTGFDEWRPDSPSDSTLSTSADLERLCREFHGTNSPFETRTNRVVTECSKKYHTFIQDLRKRGESPQVLEKMMGVDLQFAGYDAVRKTFFSYGHRIQGTIEMVAEVAFEHGPEAIASSLGFQGESAFLAAMVYGHNDKLAKLCNRKLRADIMALPFVTSPVSDEHVVECLQEMFPGAPEARISPAFQSWLHRRALCYLQDNGGRG